MPFELPEDQREIWEALKRQERWRDRKDQLKERSTGRIEGYENEVKKRIDDAIETDRNHDDLLTLTISAFGPRSQIHQRTGWHLYGAEPLYELDPSLKHPDAIIGSHDDETAVIVECKTGLSSPMNALAQIREAAENVLEHADHIEREGSLHFETVERVLCVPGRIVQSARRAIEEEESSDDPENPIYLWTIHRYQEESIQLQRGFRNRTDEKSSHNSELTPVLSGEGIDIVRDPLLSPLFYPQTNTAIVIEEAFSEILFRRSGGGQSIRKFTRGELFDLMNQQKHLPHYSVSQIAQTLCGRVIERLENFGLIEQLDPGSNGYGPDTDLYSFHEERAKGRKMRTIVSNLIESYIEKVVDRKAEIEAIEEVVDQFQSGQSSLEDFGVSD